MTTTARDLRLALEGFASSVHGGLDNTRLHRQIRHRTHLRRSASVAVAAAAAAALPVGVHVLATQGGGASRPAADSVGSTSAPSTVAPASEPPQSWIPGYVTVKEASYDYSLDRDETTTIEFSFRLNSDRDVLQATVDKLSAFGTFLHCRLEINGRSPGQERCGDLGTRTEFLDSYSQFPLFAWNYPRTEPAWGNPETVPESQEHDTIAPEDYLPTTTYGWDYLGIEPGDLVRVTYKIQYATCAGPCSPSSALDHQHDAGVVTVGVYQPTAR